MGAKRVIKHQHYILRMWPNFRGVWVKGLTNSFGKIQPALTSQQGLAWRTADRDAALALKGQLLVLCGVETYLVTAHYPGKVRPPLPRPTKLGWQPLEKLSFRDLPF